MATTYQVELANRIVRGRAVGNLYGVARYVDGQRMGWVLSPQADESRARHLADLANVSGKWAKVDPEEHTAAARLRRAMGGKK